MMRYRHTQPNFNFLCANVRSARAERSVRGWYVPLGPTPRGLWHENVIITRLETDDVDPVQEPRVRG
jgi:hypothetical protein